MTEQELYDLLDRWENIEMVVESAVYDPHILEMLFSMALNHPKQRSWRAAYLVDKIHDKDPLTVRPYIPVIIEHVPQEKNDSKRRHWLKLISMNTVPEEYFGMLFDYCIETFTSGKEAVAVRVHAMQILFNISEEEPDLKSELLEIIEHEMEYHPTAGIRSRGKKLAAKLRKHLDKFAH